MVVVHAQNESNMSQASDVSKVASESSAKVREEGNVLFKDGKYESAIEKYQECLKMKNNSKEEILAAHKNLSACFLKLDQFEESAKEASAALEIKPDDIKSLFRRSQSYLHLNKFSDAIKDGLLVKNLDPKNKEIDQLLRSINEKQQEKIKEQSRLSSKVSRMFEIAQDDKEESDKRITALENLLVLARDAAGSKFIVINENGFTKLRKIIELEFSKNPKIVQDAIRVISELCNKNPTHCQIMLKTFDGLSYLLNGLSMCKDTDLLTSIQYAIQTLINAFSGYDIKTGKKIDNGQLMAKYQDELDSIMSILVDFCNRRSMTALSRDVILELIMKNADYEVLCWGTKLVRTKTINNLLDISSELEDIKYESSMEITPNTRPHVSLVLERIYNCLDNDQTRELYRNQVKEYLDDLLRTPDVESKVRATALITALLCGPTEVGNNALGQKGLLEMMLVMASDNSDEIQQRVAAEAIIAAASKKDKCTSIVTMGTGILKQLYQSPNDAIKVRALVGLCKIGSVGGTDANFKPFSDGSISKLTLACKKFICSNSKSGDICKWAIEGFAYLSLDADVKEEIVNDDKVVNAMIDLARTHGAAVLYGITTTLVNVTNSYEKNEILPEMIELAKFAKQHIPEEHIKDKKDFVDKRVKKLAKMGISAALVSLHKTESRSARELICRIFNAICEFKECRGAVVQSGGAKALLDMALDNNTAAGKLQAGHALARIGITIDPAVAFPGQRSAEVVRPIMELLHVECSSLQNFEALMALTNLAQLSDSVAARMLKEGCFTKIEHYMYEDHVMLRRAATQCVTNLITKEKVIKLFEGDNDRVKMITILCEEDDIETAKAAAGALAMLTSVSKKSCRKIFEARRWFEILLMLCSSKDFELCHRGVVITRNIIHADRDIAEKIVETTIFEVLMAIVRPEVDDISQKVKAIAQEALDKAAELKLIKSTTDNQDNNEDEPD